MRPTKNGGLAAAVFGGLARLMPAAFDRKRGIAGGERGVVFAVGLRLGAFFHQALGRVVDAPAPGDRGHAEDKIGP